MAPSLAPARNSPGVRRKWILLQPRVWGCATITPPPARKRRRTLFGSRQQLERKFVARQHQSDFVVRTLQSYLRHRALQSLSSATMPSQDNKSNDGDAASKRSDDGHPESDAERELFEAIDKKDQEAVLQLIRNHQNLNLNCLDKDQLTPLQHACHTGDVEITRILINNGAKINYTQRSDGYTPLMFAAISAKTDIVRLLLERGADVTLENCVNRTAAQMAAFVGQAGIVSIIAAWVPYQKSVEPYTRTRELESQPRIPSRQLGHTLHNLIVFPSFHPVKLMLYIKENPDLIEQANATIYVLDDLCSKSVKPPANDETLSLRYHYLSYILQNCQKAYQAKVAETKSSESADQFNSQIYMKAMETYIRRVIKRAKPADLQPLTPTIEQFIAACIYKYPYTQLAIYKTSTYALSKCESGEMNAYSVLTQSLSGPRMFGHSSGSCSICLDTHKCQKCSQCKAVYYCGPGCQRIDWFQHKKICKSPEETPLLDEVGEGGS